MRLQHENNILDPEDKLFTALILPFLQFYYVYGNYFIIMINY